MDAASQKLKKINPNRFGPALIGMVVLLALAGCKEPSRQAVPTGSVKANAAYLKHFGEPPVIEQGTCFARVGYFPLAGEPNRLRAVPLFIFDEAEQLARLLEALPVRHWEFPSHSGLQNPFPPDTTILVTARIGDSVTIDLAVPGASRDSKAFQGMIAAVVETALQVEEINRVFITVAGVRLSEMPEDGYHHDPRRIVPAGPPLLLMVVGNWETEREDPDEIRINFDRPVDVQEIRLLDAAGREILGEYFRTGFDMTVVLHPDAPHTLREGMTIRVAWQVSDRLDRTGSGEQSFILERYAH